MWKGSTHEPIHKHTCVRTHVVTFVVHAFQEEDGGRTSAEVTGGGGETIGGEETKGRVAKVTLLKLLEERRQREKWQR